MPDHTRLLADPNFRSLWEEGPLAAHLAGLEARILSSLTDPAVRQRMCDERRGILSVLEYVEREAKTEQKRRGPTLGVAPSMVSPRRLRMMRKSVL